jgi:signal peptidase II
MFRAWLPWITAAAIVALDRWSKLLVLEHLEPGAWVSVVPGFALTHVHNRGIAFSLFSDGGPLSRIILHVVILAAVVMIAGLVVRHGRHNPIAAIAFGMILGGAVGNLVDRVLYGWVIDFVHLWARIGGRVWSWPDFNVADASITIGAALLILGELRQGRSETKDDAPDPD